MSGAESRGLHIMYWGGVPLLAGILAGTVAAIVRLPQAMRIAILTGDIPTVIAGAALLYFIMWVVLRCEPRVLIAMVDKFLKERYGISRERPSGLLGWIAWGYGYAQSYPIGKARRLQLTAKPTMFVVLVPHIAMRVVELRPEGEVVLEGAIVKYPRLPYGAVEKLLAKWRTD